MKNICSKCFFALRFAWKNIYRHKFRSLILFFSFLSLFIIALVSFSLKSIIRTYYYTPYESRYQDIDLTLGISYNTNARYFSIRHFRDSELNGKEINDYFPFFEIETIVQYQEEELSLQVLASEVEVLKKVVPLVETKTLNEDEVIITNSLAQRLNISEGDKITVYLGSVEKEFSVTEIILDYGLFQNQVIFLNRSDVISSFLKTLNPALGDMNPLYFNNLYNRIYISLSQDADREYVQNALKEIVAYRNLEIEPVINYSWLDQLVSKSTSHFSATLLIIALAVFMMMQTTINLLFADKKKDFQVVEYLGGSKSFSALVLVIEILLLVGLALLSGIVLTKFIINFGYQYLELNTSFVFENQTIFQSILVVLLILVVVLIWRFYQNPKKKVKVNKVFILLLFMLIVILTFIAIFIWPGKHIWGSFLQIPLVLLLMILLAISLIFGIKKLINHFLKSKFLDLHFKILLGKEEFYRFLSVILIATLSILLLVGFKSYQKERIKILDDEFNLDYILTNFLGYQGDITAQINKMEHSTNSTSVLLFQKTKVEKANEEIEYLVSIDEEDISEYFNFDFPEFTFSSDYPAVVLPIRFKELHGLEVGEEVSINVSPLYPNLDFQIIGFYKAVSSRLAFTNIHLLEEFQSEKANAVLLNASNHKLLRRELIENFSRNLVYIFDFQLLLKKQGDEIKKVGDYVNFIVAIMISCFVFSIINHSLLLFDKMKIAYQRYFLLGASPNRMGRLFLFEQALVLFAVILSTLVTALLLNQIIPQLVILFGEYEPLTFSLSSLLTGEMLALIVYLFANIIYLTRMLRVDAHYQNNLIQGE